jgi:hypothetical protein
LARIKFKRTRIDPSKISTPYSLLAVMLLVAEFLFAVWFWRAEGPVERSVAGSIMAAVFVSLMLIVLKMSRTSGKEKVITIP